MVSYNQVSKLTYYSENNRRKEFLDLFLSLCGSNTLLDVLSFTKYERFVEENSNIKLNYNGKEVVIFKENFLTDLPTKKSESYTLDNFEYVIGYPEAYPLQLSIKGHFKQRASFGLQSKLPISINA